MKGCLWSYLDEIWHGAAGTMFSACGDCPVHLSTLREVREKEFHLLIFVAGNGTIIIIIALSIEQMISEKNL